MALTGKQRKENADLRRGCAQSQEKTGTGEWAGQVFREKLLPELEAAERESARALSLMWLPRSVHKKS